MPAYHRAFYAIRAGVPEADAVAAGCLNDAMNRADDFSFNRIASCCRSHWGEALPGVILEIINEHQRLTTTVCGPWDPEVDKIFRLQEAGMVTPARKAMESTGIPDTEDADRQALIAWLRGRQAVLEERLDDAKRDWLNCLKLLKWRKHRHLAAEIMLDLARVHGIQQEFARETRCIRIAEYMVRNSRRPGLVERSHIRIMESALEKGNLQQVIARITAVLQPMGFEEDSRQLALVCCYGLIVAGRMDKPLQALYYGRELMQLRDAIPFEYLGRCRLAMEELRSWQPDMTESGINALLAREAEVLAEFENHPPETGGFSDGILRFFRFSQCLCDRVTMNAGVDDDAPREHNAERLKEAMRLAQGIGDERRWSRLARQLSRRKDGDIPDDPEYPPGYFKWLNRWTQSDTRETLIAMIATGMERMFGITRGFFLELRNGVWQWLDTW
nr:hypothetical protein [bacterium]